MHADGLTRQAARQGFHDDRIATCGRYNNCSVSSLLLFFEKKTRKEILQESEGTRQKVTGERFKIQEAPGR